MRGLSAAQGCSSCVEPPLAKPKISAPISGRLAAAESPPPKPKLCATNSPEGAFGKRASAGAGPTAAFRNQGHFAYTPPPFSVHSNHEHRSAKAQETRSRSGPFQTTGELENVNPEEFRGKLDALCESFNAKRDRNWVAKCAYVIQRCFTAFAPFAKNFLAIAKEGAQVRF